MDRPLHIRLGEEPAVRAEIERADRRLGEFALGDTRLRRHPRPCRLSAFGVLDHRELPVPQEPGNFDDLAQTGRR